MGPCLLKSWGQLSQLGKTDPIGIEERRTQKTNGSLEEMLNLETIDFQVHHVTYEFGGL